MNEQLVTTQYIADMHKAENPNIYYGILDSSNFTLTSRESVESIEFLCKQKKNEQQEMD